MKSKKEHIMKLNSNYGQVNIEFDYITALEENPILNYLLKVFPEKVRIF